MWRPVKLRIVNFMSYLDEEVEFNDKSATIIQGLNLTDEGFQNNGSGKSALLEALSVSILNRTLRSSTTVGDLIRRGEKSLLTYLILENSVTKEVLSVEREVFKSTSKSSTLKLESSLDPKINESYTKVDDGTKVILDRIGISREDLLNYFLISSEKFESFFSTSDTNKKNLIGRFSNSNLVDKSLDGLLVNGKSLEFDRVKLSNELESYKLTVSQLEEMIEENKVKKSEQESEQEFKDKVTERIELTKIEINNLRESNEIDSKLITEIELEISEISDKLLKLNSSKQLEEEKSLQKEKEIKEEKVKINDIEKEISELEIKLLKSVQCPNCETEFNPNSKEVIVRSSILAGIDERKEELTSIKDNLRGLLLELDTISESISNISKEMREVTQQKSSKQSEKISKEGSIKSNYSLIDNKLSLISSLEKSIEEFEIGQFDKTIETLREKISSTKQLILDTDSKRLAVEKKIEITSNWLLNLTKFKTHLSNKVIKVIECFVNEYLQRMDTDILINIDGYKINRDGSIKEKITPKLIRAKGDEAPFATFSSGERARVEIAVIFAIQKLINTSLKEKGFGQGFDFTFLDEIIDSVDSIGMYNIMRTLQSLEKPINVISHVVFESHSDEVFKTLTVVKEENIARLVEGGIEKVRNGI